MHSMDSDSDGGDNVLVPVKNSLKAMVSGGLGWGFGAGCGWQGGSQTADRLVGNVAQQ